MISSDIFLNAFQYCNTQVIAQISLDAWRTSPSSVGSANLSVSNELVSTELSRARREVTEFLQYERSLSSELSESQLMHYKTSRAKRQSIAISNQSLVLEKATRAILRNLRQGRDREAGNELEQDIESLVQALPRKHLEAYVHNQILSDNILPGEECDDKMLPCDHTTPYRTATGWCNNLAKPELGKSQNLFDRFLLPAYEDGVSSPRRSSVAGPNRSLPSPRLISVNVHGDISVPHLRYVRSLIIA